ncbi:MAG: LemA family protein [Nanoarchaeota archaeon]|nr:LemA family protein [Nanoarchaeota archaeon]
MDFTIILYVIIGILFLYVIIVFNRLILLKNGVKTTFSQVDVLTKKRIELIPRLAEFTKKYSSYEKNVLTEVSKLRTEISSSKNEALISEIFVKSGTIMNNLMIISEKYPNLKANDNFKKLFEENTIVENEIMRMRLVYNNLVEKYNNTLSIFPNNLISNFFNFKVKEFLDFELKK